MKKMLQYGNNATITQSIQFNPWDAKLMEPVLQSHRYPTLIPITCAISDQQSNTWISFQLHSGRTF